ncbi:MAG: hypothetical protein WDN66_00050 [Candidatus Saccharibacteria bacterium]
MKEKEMDQIADWISEALKNRNDDKKLASLRTTIKNFAKQYPLPS